MGDLGLMVSATCALFDLELNLSHEPVEGCSECYSVKWTEGSKTLVSWAETIQDQVNFQTKLPFPEETPMDVRVRFVQALSNAMPPDTSLSWERASIDEDGDLFLQQSLVIEDSSYTGEVGDAYLRAFQDVMLLESALSAAMSGELGLADLSDYLSERR